MTCADAMILLCSCTLCKYTSTILLHFLKGTVSHLTELECVLGDASIYKIINNKCHLFFLHIFFFLIITRYNRLSKDYCIIAVLFAWQRIGSHKQRDCQVIRGINHTQASEKVSENWFKLCKSARC